MISNLKFGRPTGVFTYKDEYGNDHSSSYDLFVIRNAWNRGCTMDDLADGFGKGLGTMNGDWSGIRDSSEKAMEKMLERAFNWFGMK